MLLQMIRGVHFALAASEKNLGVKLAIDEFATGYSNLSTCNASG